MNVTLEQARVVKEKISVELGRRPEVVGIGISRVNDGFAVKVNLAQPLPADVDVPSAVDGVQVIATVIGHVDAF